MAFDEVGDFLAENEVAMIGLYGMGGVGKITIMKRKSAISS